MIHNITIWIFIQVFWINIFLSKFLVEFLSLKNSNVFYLYSL